MLIIQVSELSKFSSSIDLIFYTATFSQKFTNQKNDFKTISYENNGSYCALKIIFGLEYWVENIRVENDLQPCIREVPFGASVTAFNTFEEMSNNTASIKALLQQMIIETSLMLAQPLCNETIVSLMANQGEDPAADFNNLPGKHSDHFCIKLSKKRCLLPLFSFYTPNSGRAKWHNCSLAIY